MAHVHAEITREKVRMNDVQRIQNQNPVCKECFETRTGDPSGVCAMCRRKGVLRPESLIERFAAALYIEKPFGSEVELPCQERPTVFDKPKASQAAREMCERCPKAAYEWCLDWGIHNDEAGIWGGLSRDERRIVHAGLPALTQGYYTLVA
jgi:hypothetical protein